MQHDRHPVVGTEPRVNRSRQSGQHGPGEGVPRRLLAVLGVDADAHRHGVGLELELAGDVGAGDGLDQQHRAGFVDRDPKVLAGPAGPLKQWAIRTEENSDAEVKRSLRQAIAAKIRRVNDYTTEPANISITAGGTGALMTALQVICGPGDEVLIPDPGWPNYEAIAVLAGAHPVRYPLHAQNGFVPDPDEIASRIGARTKAVLLNSPGNPTGAVYRGEIQARGLGMAVEVFDETGKPARGAKGSTSERR